MTPSIAIEKIWSDIDIVEFAITTSDDCSCFCVNAYLGHQSFEALVADLDCFKSKIYGGIYDLEFGKFGPEYANGAFKARLHFHPDRRGHLYITVHAESEWLPFSKTEVASCATLYLKSELGLLEKFIEELRSIRSGTDDKAIFECV